MTGPAASQGHVASDVLAAYLDRRLRGEARAQVTAHLADCAQCRAELIDAKRALRPARPRRLAIAAAGLAAAAMLALMLVPGGPLLRRADDESRVRAADESALVAYGPLGELSGAAVLTWSSAGPGAAYRVVVTAANGTPVWRLSTLDTMAALPDSVGLAPDTAYRWWVDALLPDGTTRSTGVREFHTGP